MNKNKKLVLALGCIALLTSLSTIAQADAISFAFFGSNATPPVLVNTSGVSVTNAALLAVKDTTTNTTDFLSGKVNISTGTASSYTALGGVLVAQFNPGSGVEVEVDSASCLGGSLPGVCLQGLLNTTGTYVATFGSTGSFQALFKVAYVSPYITSLFGLGNTWQQVGSDSFTTSDNIFANGGQSDVAQLGTGGVTFQTVVPEPGTMVLLGSGLIGLAGVARRRLSL
jgi:PEP-CTERM motif